MTLFGKSLFETVMAGIDARKADEEEDGDPSAPAIRGLNAGFVGRSFQYRDDKDSDPMHLFEPFLTETVTAPPPESAVSAPPRPVVPDWIHRLSAEEVAADLGLTANLTRLQLRAKRRQFARDNHPDGIAPLAYEAATQRMMIANQLIDKALKSAKS